MPHHRKTVIDEELECVVSCVGVLEHVFHCGAGITRFLRRRTREKRVVAYIATSTVNPTLALACFSLRVGIWDVKWGGTWGRTCTYWSAGSSLLDVSWKVGRPPSDRVVMSADQYGEGNMRAARRRKSGLWSGCSSYSGLQRNYNYSDVTTVKLHGLTEIIIVVYC
jgi:hypothetical protein